MVPKTREQESDLSKTGILLDRSAGGVCFDPVCILNMVLINDNVGSFSHLDMVAMIANPACGLILCGSD